MHRVVQLYLCKCVQSTCCLTSKPSQPNLKIRTWRLWSPILSWLFSVWSVKNFACSGAIGIDYWIHLDFVQVYCPWVFFNLAHQLSLPATITSIWTSVDICHSVVCFVVCMWWVLRFTPWCYTCRLLGDLHSFLQRFNSKLRMLIMSNIAFQAI